MHVAGLNGGEIQDTGVLMCQKENWISQAKQQCGEFGLKGSVVLSSRPVEASQTEF